MFRRSKEAPEKQTQDRIWHQIEEQSCPTKYFLCWPLHNANISLEIMNKGAKYPGSPYENYHRLWRSTTCVSDLLLSSDLLQCCRNTTTTKIKREHLQNELPKCLLRAPANCTLHNSHLASSAAKK